MCVDMCAVVADEKMIDRLRLAIKERARDEQGRLAQEHKQAKEELLRKQDGHSAALADEGSSRARLDTAAAALEQVCIRPSVCSRADVWTCG